MRTKRILKWTGGTLITLLVLAALLFVQVWYFRPFSIDIFYERIFIQFLLKLPESLTDVGLLRQAGYRGLDDELNDVSPRATDDLAQLVRKDLDQLHGYDRNSLTPSQQLSYDTLDWFLTDAAAGERWRYHDYPVNQMFGEQAETADFMVRVHPIGNAEDARNYNRRLAAFPQKFGGLLEGVKLRASKGVIPPKFVIMRVLEQMRAFIATPAKDNILYINLRDKLAKLQSSVSPDERTELLDGARNAIDEHVYPAYRELITYFEELDQQVHEDYGVWKLPDGDAYYDYLVHHHTTTSMDAQAVHELGLAEVARIEKEMDAILQGQGLKEGTIGARMTALSEEPRALYSDDDAGRQQCLADFQHVMDEMIRGLPAAFRNVPKLNVRVERVPAFKEATVTGAYADSGSLDGTRPATFFVNLRDMKEQPKFGVRTLAYHEGVPGHLLQGSIANALVGVPTFRKVLSFTAYDEGWGLYAERLAWELGYENDPLDNLGRLQLEMLRAVRLVVDTGIHRKRWTREQAIDYMLEKTGRARGDVVGEIERYFVMPGQALAYKVGMERILQLRERSRIRLGTKFDLRDFHGVVLTNGPMPLGTLEAQVDAWLNGPSPR